MDIAQVIPRQYTDLDNSVVACFRPIKRQVVGQKGASFIRRVEEAMAIESLEMVLKQNPLAIRAMLSWAE